MRRKWQTFSMGKPGRLKSYVLGVAWVAAGCGPSVSVAFDANVPKSVLNLQEIELVATASDGKGVTFSLTSGGGRFVGEGATYIAPVENTSVVLRATSTSTPTALADITIEVTSLRAALRQGGYVLYTRHASSNTGIDKDQYAGMGTEEQIKSCDPEVARQIDTPVGINEAIELGDNLRSPEPAIRFGKQLTSLRCRCVMTADLMNVNPTSREFSADLTTGSNARDAYIVNATALLAEVPPAGLNTSLVSHFSSTDLHLALDSAETAIFKPTGDGQSHFVSRVLYSQWKLLQ
jgi:hypothetical protein